MYDLEEKRLIKEIKKRRSKRIILQLPDGLKKTALYLSGLIKKLNIEVIVSGENCYGGCDLALREAEELKADLIVHYGHGAMVRSKMDVIYFMAESKIKLDKKKILEFLKDYKKICLVASVQYLEQLKELKRILMDKEIIIPKKKGFLGEGQIIGCDYGRLKKLNVECFLVLGSRFHGLGAALSLNRKVISINDCGIEDLSKERDKIIRQRVLLIEKLKNKKKFGIILNLKPGQRNFKTAKYLEKEFLKNKKEAMLISMVDICNDKLLNFYNIDVFVNTGCVRLSLDDVKKFERPIINVKEAMVLLNKIKVGSLIEKSLF